LKFVLPKIYPITDPTLSSLSHAEQARRLIEGGASLIQVRDKIASPAEFYEAAAEAVELAQKRKVKIVVNDRVDVALAVGADGVHLGQDDLPPDEARKILGPDAILGFSTHSIEQALAAMKLPIDYIAIGPIFSTSTKMDAESTVGIEGLRRVRRDIGAFPLVAIGGVNRTNVASVVSAGADSAAVIGDVISGDAYEITSRMRELLKILNSTANIVGNC